MARRKIDPNTMHRIETNALGTDPISFGEASCRHCKAPLTYALGPHLPMAAMDQQCSPTREVRCLKAFEMIWWSASQANQ